MGKLYALACRSLSMTILKQKLSPQNGAYVCTVYLMFAAVYVCKEIILVIAQGVLPFNTARDYLFEPLYRKPTFVLYSHSLGGSFRSSVSSAAFPISCWHS